MSDTAVVYGSTPVWPAVQPREQRPGRARERDADARLQDAVAVGDAADARIEASARFSGCVMMPISCARGVARQARVAVERDAVAHLRQDRQRRRRAATKLVSVAPRSRRLNSSILPRLRSHPIQRPSCAFHWRVRWNRKNRSAAPSPCFALSASMPARGRRENLARRAAASPPRRRGSRSGWRNGCAGRGCRAPGPRGARPARAPARRCRGSSARSPSCAPIVGNRGRDRAAAGAAAESAC